MRVHADGRTPRSLGLGIETGSIAAARSAHGTMRVISSDKPLTAGSLAIPLKRHVCKRLLLHRRTSLDVMRSPLQHWAERINQRFPSNFALLSTDMTKQQNPWKYHGARLRASRTPRFGGTSFFHFEADSHHCSSALPRGGIIVPLGGRNYRNLAVTCLAPRSRPTC